jgi:hypothetical protein
MQCEAIARPSEGLGPMTLGQPIPSGTVVTPGPRHESRKGTLPLPESLVELRRTIEPRCFGQAPTGRSRSVTLAPRAPAQLRTEGHRRDQDPFSHVPVKPPVGVKSLSFRRPAMSTSYTSRPFPAALGVR